MALLALLLLIFTASAITDCEVCKIITPIYGACSPELVELYANETGQVIEWVCLIETGFDTPEKPENETIHVFSVGFANSEIRVETNEGSMVIRPILETRGNWTWWVNRTDYGYKFGIISTSERANSYQKLRWEVYAPWELKTSTSLSAQAPTNYTYKGVGLTLDDISSTITGGMETPYGHIVYSEYYTDEKGVAELDPGILAGGGLGCSYICLDPSDFLYLVCNTNGSVSVPVGGSFSMTGYWNDYKRTCTTSSCIIAFEKSYWSVIPAISLTGIDCSGALCRSMTDPPRAWPTTHDIDCEGVASGLVRVRFSGVAKYSNQKTYSCISPNNPPDVYLSSPANNTNITSPYNFTFYVIDDEDASGLNCSIWINGTLYGHNASVTNNTNTTFPYLAINETGNYSWFVACEDTDGEVTVSDTWHFTIWLNNPFGWALAPLLIAIILTMFARRSEKPVMQFLFVCAAFIAIIIGLSGMAFQSQNESSTVENMIWTLEIITYTISSVVILMFIVVYVQDMLRPFT